MRRTVYKIRQAEDKDMENEVMQEQAKRVADKILRLEAYTEIQNNMGSCVLSYNYRRPEEVLSFFTSREDATLETVSYTHLDVYKRQEYGYPGYL